MKKNESKRVQKLKNIKKVEKLDRKTPRIEKENKENKNALKIEREIQKAEKKEQKRKEKEEKKKNKESLKLSGKNDNDFSKKVNKKFEKELKKAEKEKNKKRVQNNKLKKEIKKKDNIYNFEEFNVTTEDGENNEIDEEIFEEDEIYEKEPRKIEITKSKVIKAIIFTIIAIILIIVLSKYTTDEDFRYLVDLKILKKEVTDDSLKTIEINSDSNPSIFSYGNYIGILSKGVLNLYDSNANQLEKISVNISMPIIETNGSNAVVAEKGEGSFYVLKNMEILWQGNVDGKISKVNINKNGYVTVIASNTTYNSVIVTFDSNGNELFKVYMPSTYAMCTAISTDNSLLAIGEVDYSGTVIKSNIRIYDVKNAQMVYNYSAENNNIITNLKYINKVDLICEFTDSIIKINKTEGTEIYKISDDTCFADIEMPETLVVLEKQSSGLFSYDYNLKIKNLNNNSENLYILSNSLPQQMILNDKYIGLNYGNEVEFVRPNGTLKKKFTSGEQIKSVVIADDMAGIIYKDKIKIIKL